MRIFADFDVMVVAYAALRFFLCLSLVRENSPLMIICLLYVLERDALREKKNIGPVDDLSAML